MENEVCRNNQSRSLYCFSKNYFSEEELTENRMVRHVVFSAWRPMGTPKVYFEDFDKQTWPTISLWIFFFFLAVDRNFLKCQICQWWAMFILS